MLTSNPQIGNCGFLEDTAIHVIQWLRVGASSKAPSYGSRGTSNKIVTQFGFTAVVKFGADRLFGPDLTSKANMVALT